jgi:hypothetical protein
MAVRTYITGDECFVRATDIPWAAALSWTIEANPAELDALSRDADGRWTNKYALTVGETNRGDLWLYNHDGNVWLVETPWKQQAKREEAESAGPYYGIHKGLC